MSLSFVDHDDSLKFEECKKIKKECTNVVKWLLAEIKHAQYTKTKNENQQLKHQIQSYKKTIKNCSPDLTKTSNIKKNKKTSQKKSIAQKNMFLIASLIERKINEYNYFCKKVDLCCSFFVDRENYISERIIESFNSKTKPKDDDIIQKFQECVHYFTTIENSSTPKDSILQKKDYNENFVFYVLCSSYIFFVSHAMKKCLMMTVVDKIQLIEHIKSNACLHRWVSIERLCKTINIGMHLTNDSDIKLHTRKNLINFENNKNISINHSVYQCPKCKNNLIMNFDKSSYLCVNQKCAIIVPCSENISSNVSYERETCFNKGTSEKREHLKDRFNNVQTVDNRKIEEKMLCKVMNYLHDTMKIKNPSEIQRKHIRFALQQCNSKNYNQVEQIYQILTGEQQHSFFEIEKCVQHIFKMSENSFEDLKNTKQINRSNMPFYGNLMKKICKIMGFDEIVPSIQILKGKDNNENTNKDIEKIIDACGIISK